jgi:uncharacterized protein UPF0167
MLGTHFDYFHGPVQEMSHLAQGERRCSFCETTGLCFSLEGDEYGCIDCLRRGRFYFSHQTEVGYLSPDEGLSSETGRQRKLARTFNRANLAALLRTPQFVTWQGERWLVHCDDFMTYLGEWKPHDFQHHAPNGDGRKLFMGMFDQKELAALWDETTPAGAKAPEDWSFHVHVFRCRHCGILRGHWDCD